MDICGEDNPDRLEKDFQAFMDALADEGIIRRVALDGVNFYFREGDPGYEEYLARKEESARKKRSRHA